MLVKIIVTVFGVGLIILVNWYFLFSRRKAFQSELKEKGIQPYRVHSRERR
jgi:plastocyanin domain-containing protein